MKVEIERRKKRCWRMFIKTYRYRDINRDIDKDRDIERKIEQKEEIGKKKLDKYIKEKRRKIKF